jgi:hypothetical protein
VQEFARKRRSDPRCRGADQPMIEA